METVVQDRWMQVDALKMKAWKEESNLLLVLGGWLQNNKNPT